MVSEFGFTVIEGDLPVEAQQKKVREIVGKVLQGFKGLPNPLRPARSHHKKPALAPQGGQP